MQDRVPTPGKENRVRIRLDDGQTIEGVFEYADEASVQGSAYNKANVLPDDVCTALGLPTSIEPKDAFAALNKKGGWTELERITTSKTWTVPDGVTQIGVFLIGGGQSGEASSQYSYTYSVYGGCSGCIKNAVINVTPGQKFNVVIGSGGSKVTVTDLKAEGKPGGDTSFGDIVAKGGGNEVKPLNKAKSFQYGAQMPCDYASSEQAPSGGCNIGFFGGALGTFYIFNTPISESCNCFSHMKVACAGASCIYSHKDSDVLAQSQATSDLGNGGKAGHLHTSSPTTVNAGAATGYGNGGGACQIRASGSSQTGNKAISGAGSPGIVIIYV